jgi:hypothetical protein
MTMTEVSMGVWCSVQDGESVVVFAALCVCCPLHAFETRDQARDQSAPFVCQKPARFGGVAG